MSSDRKRDPSAVFDRAPELQTNIDRFFFVATPKVYEWLRWVITLAAMTYVQRKTGTSWLKVLIWVTYGLTFGYFGLYFYQFKVTALPLIKSRRVVGLISIALSGLLGYATWLLVSESVNAVVASQP